MLNPTLRPYQLEAIENALQAIANGVRAGLFVLPTGTGKTITAIELLRLLKLPSLFLVHRDELVIQTAKTIRRSWPMARIGIVKAARNEHQNRDVVIASVQSLNENRLAGMSKDQFAIIVPDEAHHSVSPSWTRAIQYFDAAFRLGLTATPDRLDGKGLAELFGHEPLFSMQLIEAIRKGYLCRISQWAVETEINLDGIETRMGDFAVEQLANAVNHSERNQAIVESFLEHGNGRRAAVFCVNVQHAYDLALAFNENGVSAAVVTGATEINERREILERFKAGKLRVVTNCEVLTEGWDFPELDCIIPARPTKSRALYQQIIGRGLRLAEGKKDCLVLDPTDNCRRHKLVTLTSLLGVKKKDTDGQDLIDVLDEEEQEEKRHQEELRQPLGRPVIWRLDSVCPWPTLPTLEGYSPDKPWHDDPASDKQTSWIKRFGLGIEKELTKGEAGWLIDQCIQFEAVYPSPATPKQEYRLRLEGLWEEGLTKKQASNLIARLRQEERTVA